MFRYAQRREGELHISFTESSNAINGGFIET